MAVWGLVNISGPLPVLLEKKVPFAHIGYVHAVTATTGQIQLYLLERITSVTLAIILRLFQVFFTPMTLSGTARGVVLIAPAANSTTPHGSVRPSPSPPLMTWRSGSVIMEVLMIHLSSCWSSMYNRMQLILLF